MATLVTFPAARKTHRCDGRRWDDCAMTIPTGVRYCRSVVTPNDGDVGNVGWWMARLCPSCATYYGCPIPEAVAS